MNTVRPDVLDSYEERYQSIYPESLRVTAHLDAAVPVIAYDPPTLDGMLSWAVVHEATRGALLPSLPAGEAYRLPLPLQPLAWLEHLPLWAATPLYPDGESAVDSSVECKREQTGRWTKTPSGRLNIDSAAGRWRARMIPRPALLAERLAAVCVGDGDEVARLLRSITHIGKRRASGGGLIRRWSVEAGPPWALVEDGRLVRSVPEGLDGRLGFEPSEGASLVAWTPAYWNRALWRSGWPAGSPVKEAARV